MELVENIIARYEVLTAELFAQRHSITCDEILIFKSNIVTQSNIKLTRKNNTNTLELKVHFIKESKTFRKVYSTSVTLP